MSYRPGYDKYYLTVDCSGCGAYTGEQYAYRFGHEEPVVYCSSCKKLRNKRCSGCRKLLGEYRAKYYEVCRRCEDKAYIEDYLDRHYGRVTRLWSGIVFDDCDSYDSASEEEYNKVCKRYYNYNSDDSASYGSDNDSSSSESEVEDEPSDNSTSGSTTVSPVAPTPIDSSLQPVAPTSFDSSLADKQYEIGEQYSIDAQFMFA